MTKTLHGAALLAALLLSGVSTVALMSPALAQDDSYDQNYDGFHDQLAQYGDWIYSDRWGEVWVPDTDENFSPYNTNGYWAYTNDYGWTWVSNYEWGDIPFHYGRWVNDPDDGWLWIPGYVWSPAWVAWRSNGSYIGWMALPPDEAFLNGGEDYSGGSLQIGIDFGSQDGYYGYSRWYDGYDENRFAANWVFVNPGHMADRNFHQFAAPPSTNITIVRNTTNITNYTIINNHVVNRGISVALVNRAGGHVTPVRAETIIRNPSLITSFSAGRATQLRARSTNPHGTGVPMSAPKPSAQIVRSLSSRVPPKLAGRGPSAHLFTRTTIVNAPLPPKRGGPVPGGGRPFSPNGTGPQGGPNQPPRGQTPGAVTPGGAGAPDTTVPTNGRRKPPGDVTPGSGQSNGAPPAANPSTPGAFRDRRPDFGNPPANGAAPAPAVQNGGSPDTTKPPRERHRPEDNGTTNAPMAPATGNPTGNTMPREHHRPEDNGTTNAPPASGSPPPSDTPRERRRPDGTNAPVAPATRSGPSDTAPRDLHRPEGNTTPRAGTPNANPPAKDHDNDKKKPRKDDSDQGQ